MTGLSEWTIEYPASVHGKTPLRLVLWRRMPSTLQFPSSIMLAVSNNPSAESKKTDIKRSDSHALPTLIVANVMLLE
jgi:hypothetical protein